MRIMAITLKTAEDFLSKHERHYKAPVEAICAIGVGDDEGLHGAAILGRNSEDAELAHIYCDGASQAYSLLYGACWRALKALGYVRAVL
jgi:hypothetical protein